MKKIKLKRLKLLSPSKPHLFRKVTAFLANNCVVSSVLIISSKGQDPINMPLFDCKARRV